MEKAINMGYVVKAGTQPVAKYVMEEIENSVARFDVKTLWSYDEGDHWTFFGEGGFFHTRAEAEDWCKKRGLEPLLAPEKD